MRNTYQGILQETIGALRDYARLTSDFASSIEKKPNGVRKAEDDDFDDDDENSCPICYVANRFMQDHIAQKHPNQSAFRDWLREWLYNSMKRETDNSSVSKSLQDYNSD